ncbi:UDP-2,4-diacetamido-2,4,6-trideoxy-beta-L-altropyranose hydrolase [Pollutimonas sp. M17]|uniref:UDP-2,4-diacetamido-2,4, 6-trideoxy-beta-L-altropyranose hydrolase n=1 Tax=Pollutimonas sp. M17 TaxID=2962065 RepID=UPI0021F4CC95|nr:UDP-2,4-diacetamido-2,4,6-trideoxy-beta-L-altropyranose hydrolase [Pollutimonas sp. M17]UYO93979.1 UDP-2,4-diacetamido-2,4,6-trideoxy-beta-L-altropyranose hydrolase [Pollutimonas sp. M17]
MKIAFRTDASLDIGSGHVMRCLTLADALRDRGASCHFICREHSGHLLELIQERGYNAIALPIDQAVYPNLAKTTALHHAHWLGTDWQSDAEQTRTAIGVEPADWLIVDHYSLDANWECVLAPYCSRLMVIDDLADRPHICDLLLDQTFGRAAEDYHVWVPTHCQLLCGSHHAILRPEFEALRTYSLQRRTQPQLRQLLITMGGIDKDNVTGQVLATLPDCALPDDCEITVVMGIKAPWQTEVECQAQSMPWPTRVLVGVTDMAQIMADSDLAIGAAGVTSWERCCLGLPTIMLMLAENQLAVARGLARSGAVQLIERSKDIQRQLPALLDQLVASLPELTAMSNAASTIADGQGINTVISFLEG